MKACDNRRCEGWHAQLDGRVYTGEWKEDKPHGHGTNKGADGGSTLVNGEMAHGMDGAP